MQHPETDTGPFDPHWGEKEQTVSLLVPLMTGTALSQNPGILASEGILASYVLVASSGNMSLVLPSWKPWSDLGLTGHSLVPETLK